MKPFDISEVYSYGRPMTLCDLCRAIVPSFTTPCPICGQKNRANYSLLRGNKNSWNMSEVWKQISDLAPIAQQFQMEIDREDPDPQFSNISWLYEALNKAKFFINFTTYGMSVKLFGALEMVAMSGVYVSGIVSGANKYIQEEVATNDSPGPIDIWALPSTSKTAPHQKIIVIDGLVAFTGSSNLTVSGWRKAEKGFDYIEVVTELTRIKELNNKQFSRPRWELIKSGNQEPKRYI